MVCQQADMGDPFRFSIKFVSLHEIIIIPMKRFLFFLAAVTLVLTLNAQTHHPTNEMQVNNQYRGMIMKYLQQDVQKRQKQMSRDAMQMLVNLPNAEKLYDETLVHVKNEIVEGTREDGSNELNHLFQVDYTCGHLEGYTDDFPLGSYDCNRSNSSRALCAITKHMVENVCKDLFTRGTEVTINIYASTDATNITHIDYLGEYGDFRYCPAIYNNESVRISVSQEEGISTNAQLAYMRAMSVKNYLESHIDMLRQTNNTYKIITRCYSDTGSQFRRNSISLEVHGAYDAKALEMSRRLRQDEFVDFNIPVNEESSNRNTFAIIIANEEYDVLPNVPFADNDGDIIQQYCLKTLGIPQRHIKLLKNADAATIKTQGIAWIKDITVAVKGDANIIVYFAGHGISGNDSRPYLIPAGVKYDELKTLKGKTIGTDDIQLSSREIKKLLEQCIAVDTLANWFNRVQYRNLTLIVDASLNGTQRNGQPLFTLGKPATKKGRGMRLRNNIVVWLAANTDKTAYAYDDQHHGFLTYFMLKELKRTQGDITYEELYSSIDQALSYESSLQGKLQQPVIIAGGKIKESWGDNRLR